MADDGRSARLRRRRPPLLGAHALRRDPRYLVAGSAVAGAACTAAIAAAVSSALPAIALRFLTGVALAGVYPPGTKLFAGWFREGRGFAIGVLVGSLTVGSALPHLIRALGGVVAGSAADRLGRTRVTSASMAVSGLACLAAGVVFGRATLLLVPFVLIWGAAIVADSARFSAAVSELAEPPTSGRRLPSRPPSASSSRRFRSS